MSCAEIPELDTIGCAAINRLPTEVFSNILHQTRYTSTAAAFLPCISVCRHWKEIGETIFWASVVLTHANIAAFLATNLSHLSLVRSLTVLIEIDPLVKETLSPRETSEGTRQLWRQLGALADLVARMVELTTFSLRVVPPSSITPSTYNFYLRRVDLDRLIRSLPETCTSLELDTQGLDQGSHEMTHLCPTLRRTLPQLENLRLRLRSLCPHFLQTSGAQDGVGNGDDIVHQRAPLLRSLTMGLHTAPLCPSGTWLCSSPDKEANPDYYYHSYSSQPTLARRTVLEATQRAYQGGSFPVVRHLDLFDTTYHTVHSPGDRDYDALYHRDIIADETCAFPRPFLHDLDQGRNYMLRTRTGQEYIGGREEIDAVVEGPSWHETPGGARYPASFATSESAKRAGYAWKPIQLIDRAQFLKQSPKRRLRLWSREERLERPLLTARVTPGLFDFDVVHEEYVRFEEDTDTDDGEDDDDEDDL
ncbi:MAG: hypothetical protein M1833_004797 [Piccolia ochrophora]|nr:MAG: hypothetical protein M1833_004797 [Piccolia ochrophora]